MKKLLTLCLLPLVLACGKLPVSLGTAVEGTMKAVEAFRPISESEEYYLGRAVAANILQRYKPWKNEAWTRHVNSIGLLLAYRSDRPEIFGGYHFAILDSDEINALSAPGGIVMLTRGLIRTAANEDELAAVIAHEITHLVLRHPTKAVKSQRVKALAMFGAKELAAGGNEIVNVFKDSVLDVTGTLIDKGYSRDQEYDADAGAARLLARCGYCPRALGSMLEKLQDRETRKMAVFSAHPKAADRCRNVQKAISADKSAVSSQRTRRFKLLQAQVGI